MFNVHAKKANILFCFVAGQVTASAPETYALLHHF